MCLVFFLVVMIFETVWAKVLHVFDQYNNLCCEVQKNSCCNKLSKHIIITNTINFPNASTIVMSYILFGRNLSVTSKDYVLVYQLNNQLKITFLGNKSSCKCYVPPLIADFKI